MNARILALALILLFGFDATARAEDLKKPTKADALKHYEAGKGLFKAGRFQAAIVEYQTSAQLEQSPAASFSLGQSYRMLVQHVDQDPKEKREHLGLAVFHYERFLATTTNTPEYTALANQHVTWSRSELDAIRAAEPAISALPVVRNVVASPDMPIEAPRAEDQPRSAARWHDDRFGLALLGAGLVGIGASGLLFWSAASLRDEASHTATQSENEELRDRADRRSLTATIIGVGSGLVLVVAITKLAIVEDEPPRRAAMSPAHRTRTTSNVGLTVSPRGIALFGQF
ncbi:MAG: hypothetical protein H0T46_07315 [Deltaproteobacteria bacterium]|nr:hypothetical protein [Deltaproteobacteria bacterium]